MSPARVDLDVVAALQGVDRAVAPGHRAEAGLLLPQPELVAPVEALAVRARRVLEPQAPADVRDLRVGEDGDETAQRVGRPRRVGVRERDHVAGRLPDGAVLRGHLAAARAVEQPHARLPRRYGLDELVRPVARRVGGDDDLEPVGG